MGQLVITPVKVTVVILDTAALSSHFNLSKYSSGHLLMPAAITAAGLGFKISDAVGGTYVALIDSAGNEVEVAAAMAVDIGYPIPAAVFGLSNVKLWSETAGSDVAQGADRSFVLLLKE